MAQQIFSRFEIKYQLNTDLKNKFISQILDHLTYDENSGENKFYCIYNLYFDTKENDLIRVSCDKPVFKEKLRLRTYQFPCSDLDLVFLEMKRKYKGKVYKRRVTLKYGEALDYFEKGILPKFELEYDHQIFKEIDYMVKRNQLVPKWFLSYKRIAFYDKDNKDLRITFDKDIIERKDSLNFAVASGRPLFKDDLWLMEIKCSDSYPLWLSKLLGDLKIYPKSFSKYGFVYKREKEENKKCIPLI